MLVLMLVLVFQSLVLVVLVIDSLIVDGGH
jgi:hypothetical protein